MTYLVERLADLRKHLDHLKALRPRVNSQALRADLSLHNDVLFSLLMVCQLVIDVAGELSAERGMAFEDYTQAVRNLAALKLVSHGTLAELERLPGFRNILVHEYVALDMDRVVEAINRLDPIEEFSQRLQRLLTERSEG